MSRRKAKKSAESFGAEESSVRCPMFQRMAIRTQGFKIVHLIIALITVSMVYLKNAWYFTITTSVTGNKQPCAFEHSPHPVGVWSFIFALSKTMAGIRAKLLSGYFRWRPIEFFATCYTGEYYAPSSTKRQSIALARAVLSNLSPHTYHFESFAAYLAGYRHSIISIVPLPKTLTRAIQFSVNLRRLTVYPRTAPSTRFGGPLEQA